MHPPKMGCIVCYGVRDTIWEAWEGKGKIFPLSLLIANGDKEVMSRSQEEDHIQCWVWDPLLPPTHPCHRIVELEGT